MQRFKNILFIINDPESSRNALARALQLVERNHAKITIFHVVKDPPNQWDLLAKIRQQITLKTQQELITLYQNNQTKISPEHIDILIESGEPFVEIIRKVLKGNYDMVFKAADTTAKKRSYGFLTLDMHLLRKCPCPVWLFKDNKNSDMQRKLLAAIDPDHELPKEDNLTKTILELSTSLRVRENDAHLDILHCWDAPYESTLRNNTSLNISNEEIIAYIDNLKGQHLKAFDLVLSDFNTNDKKIKLHFEKASPKVFIPEFVEKHQIDTLIMGTVARTGISGLLIGNTAEEILGKVDCSVLAIKPSGFETPVK